MRKWMQGAVVALAVTVAACGGPQEPASPAETPATPAPSEPAPSTPPAAAPDTPVPAPAPPPAPAAPPAAEKSPESAAPDTSKPSAAKHGPGVYAHITTNHGVIVARLFQKEAPATIENFVGLAEGKKQWFHPRSRSMVRRPYYNNLTFHRVIDGFMIQGGDPEGTGTGGPGYTFEDEIHPELRHSKAGILSMANRGPNTNGGQFFITLAPTPWLDGKHTVFGEVVEGMDTVRAIGKVPTTGKGGNPAYMPSKPVVMKTVRIERVS